MRIEPLNFSIVDEVGSPDLVAKPVWHPFPTGVSTDAGELYKFPYKDYVSGADAFFVTIGDGEKQSGDGTLRWTPEASLAGTVVEIVIEGVNSETTESESQTLSVTVN